MAKNRRTLGKILNATVKIARSPLTGKAVQFGERIMRRARGENAKSPGEWLRAIKAELPPGLAEDLSRGQLPLTEALIREHTSRFITRVGNLDWLKCKNSGIRLQLTTKRQSLRPSFVYASRIMVHGLSITPARQELVFLPQDETLRGGDLLGWIVAPLAKAIVVCVYGSIVGAASGRYRLDGLRLRPSAEEDRAWVADLSEMAFVKRLREPLLLGRSALDLVTITGCEHADQKVLLRGCVRLADAIG